MTYLVKSTTIEPVSINVDLEFDGILENPNEYNALERIIIHDFHIKSGELKERRRQRNLERGKPKVTRDGETNTPLTREIEKDLKRYIKGWKQLNKK
jgi:hypothetical protein